MLLFFFLYKMRPQQTFSVIGSFPHFVQWQVMFEDTSTLHKIPDPASRGFVVPRKYGTTIEVRDIRKSRGRARVPRGDKKAGGWDAF